jgi:YidC/Oxa1 family membrane protein insertase
MKIGLGYDWDELARFNKLSDSERSIIFYVEDECSLIYFKSIMMELINEYGLKVCYVTSSKTDPMLNCNDKNILPFYIGDGVARSNFFINLKATIIVMTMPDLEIFHIKRSKVYPVHYIYIFHSLVSTHLVYRKQAFDHFDTIFCTGNYQIIEIREREKKYNMKSKNLVKHGYGRLDDLMQESRVRSDIKKNETNKKQILLAPSWGENGLTETIGKDIINCLLDFGYYVILRPHPMTQKKFPEKIKKIEEIFNGNSNFKLETDIRVVDSFYSSDCIISDWSGVAMEYAFALEKPVLFVDVPKKMRNPDFAEISSTPLEITIRDKIGDIISPAQLSQLRSKIEFLCDNSEQFRKQIKKIRSELIFNIGESEKFGAEQINLLLKQKTV